MTDAKTKQTVTDDLPERDTTKTAEQQGLFRKFDVRRVDGSDQLGGKHHGCRYYVLDVDHDPYAAAALGAYADACKESHPELARDLREKWGAADTNDTLRAQLAEAQRRIKELETPTMFWDFNNPEHGAFDSPYYAICDGDFDEGAEVSFMTARALPTKTVRVTRDSEGSYDYEYIDAAKDV